MKKRRPQAKPSKQKRALYTRKECIGLFFVLAGIVTSAFFTNDILMYRLFESNTSKAKATVFIDSTPLFQHLVLYPAIRQEPIKAYGYSFVVDGKIYKQNSHYGFISEKLKAGDVIDVEYVKEEPKINRPVRQDSEAHFIKGLVIGVVLFIYGVATYFWPMRKQQK
ncbi:MAG: hypothetical protein EB060_01675 [Proteobacteria bacterium]|nr:hypothetical protein [Pseudomonadota bacterium]